MTEHGSVYYPDKKALPGWVKIVIWLAILAAIAIGFVAFFTQGLVESAEGQLEAIRQKNLSRAYYEYTSRDFQATTSFEAFQEFVKSHPALARNVSANFGDRTIDNNVGKLQATLTSKDGSITPIEYKFVKEGERWKILTMRLMPTGILTPGLSSDDMSYLSEPVEGHLQALQNNDIARAYFGYTSKDFQQSTPLKSFKEFVAGYPLLTAFKDISYGEDGISDEKNGTLEVTLTNGVDTSIVEYKLVNEDGEWKIWSLKLNVPSEEGKRDVAAAEQDNLMKPIEAQLAFLRAEETSKAYYESSSNEFRSTTSMTGFKSFIKNYPDLTQHKTVTFENPSVQGNMATITALLSSSDGTTPVDYQLIRNGNQWKVWGMQVASKPASLEKPPAFDTADLANAIEGQLEAIRSTDLSKAYYAFTSREFQKSTTSPEFEKFVRAHDVLSKNRIANFTNLSFKNGVGTFQGSLTSTTGKTSQVDYDLIFEDGKWRILSIQLVPDGERKRVTKNRAVALAEGPNELKPSTPSTSSSRKTFTDTTGKVELSRILVSDTTDQSGRVEIPKSIFSSKEPKLHVDVYVRDGDPGAKATLVLEHIDSRTAVPAVEASIKDRGESILSYVFTAPSQGWPQGAYRLIARTPGSQDKIYSFRIQ